MDSLLTCFCGRLRQESRLARIEWEGDSYRVLLTFPEAVIHNIGYALYLAQLGEIVPGSRRMASVGPGVFEIREQDVRGWCWQPPGRG